MTRVPLAASDWRRTTAEEAEIKVQNRFFEQNPTNLEEGSSLIIRPGFRRFTNISGVTGIFSQYYQDGLFDGDFFAISAGDVHRITSTGTQSNINTVYSSGSRNTNRGCFTAAIGDIPGYFFMADDTALYVYAEEAFATGTLTSTGTPEEGARVIIDGIYYQFTSGSVDTGSPAGTSANPWLVARASLHMTKLWSAINLKGTPGTDYSSATTKHPTVNGHNLTLTTLQVYASPAGSTGNSIATTVAATAVLSWGAATLTGGGGTPPNTSFRVPLPDEITSITAIVTYLSHVIILANTLNSETHGRFYWIEPGDLFVDSLNFATAETDPDRLVSCRVVGDRLWLLGEGTTEVWYATGDTAAPFIRAQGSMFEFGTLEGSDVVIQDSLIIAERNNKVIQFDGSTYSVISDNGISERLRKFQAKAFVSSLVNTIRTWFFELDGHLFYVMNLGQDETLIYDMTTKQWITWFNLDETYLMQHAGILYSGGSGNVFLVGDTVTGQIWTVDTDYRFDDIAGSLTNFSPFLCKVTGGISTRLRETIKCNAVYLTASLGNPSVDEDAFSLIIDDDGFFILDDDGSFLVSLELTGLVSPFAANQIFLDTSDDSGHSWVTHTPINVIEDDFTQELAWRSLGTVFAPGRLFSLYDYGAVTRIDGLDIR